MKENDALKNETRPGNTHVSNKQSTDPRSGSSVVTVIKVSQPWWSPTANDCDCSHNPKGHCV